MTEQMKKLAEEVISQLLPVSGYNEIGKQILGLRAVLQEMDEKNR